MDRLVTRHRRKAGSGPPADALIAWVSTDPYLRAAAATVSHRREMELPLPSHTRAAKAAIAACFVLTCGAVLGITTIISHGRNTTLYEAAPPPPRQGSAAAATPDSSPTFRAEAGSDPALSTAPVGMAPALAERTASQSITIPLTGERIDQVAGAQPGIAPGDVRSGARTAAIPTILPKPTGEQHAADRPTDPTPSDHFARPAGTPTTPTPTPRNAEAAKPVDTGRPADTNRLAEPVPSPVPSSDTGTTTTPAKPTMSGEPAVPIGAGPPRRAAGHSPADVVHERLARAHQFFEKFDVRTAASAR